MITLEIPGRDPLKIQHLVLDYNGTMAVDGNLYDGVKEVLSEISEYLTVHVITADTFGSVQSNLNGIDLTIKVLDPGRQDIAKKNYVDELGAESCVSIGNGLNDNLMLKQSALGIALIQNEGASSATLAASDIVCRQFTDAVRLLLKTDRLKATLRV